MEKYEKKFKSHLKNAKKSPKSAAIQWNNRIFTIKVKNWKIDTRTFGGTGTERRGNNTR